MNSITLEFILLSVGIIFIIIAFFRPSENIIVQEKIENVLEDFVTRIDIENEEMISKLKESQEKTSANYYDRLEIVEEKVLKLDNKINDISTSTNINTNTTDSIPEEDSENNIPEYSLHLKDKYLEVIKLYQSNISIEEIVEKTGISHAEIKLILQLNKKVEKNV